MRHVLGGCEVLQDDGVTTATVIREIVREVFSVCLDRGWMIRTPGGEMRKCRGTFRRRMLVKSAAQHSSG